MEELEAAKLLPIANAAMMHPALEASWAAPPLPQFYPTGALSGNSRPHTPLQGVSRMCGAFQYRLHAVCSYVYDWQGPRKL